MEEKPVLYISTVSQNENLPVVLRPLREQGKRTQEIVMKSYYYYHVSIIKREVDFETLLLSR
jgi:hypothetical protein